MAKPEKQQALDAIVEAIKLYQGLIDNYNAISIMDVLAGRVNLRQEDVESYNKYTQVLKGLWNARERIEKH